MARSELVSAAGKVFEFVKGIAQEVQDLGGGDEDLGRVLSEKQLRRKLAELIVGASKQKIEDIFAVSVEYDKSVSDLVRDGRYDWQNSDIAEKHFPTSESGKQELELRLIRFEKAMSSEAVLSELDRMGLRPAALKELLAFGATYKEEQKKYPIVALGSVWRDSHGYRSVPYLDGHSGYRRLGLGWFGGDWSGDCRFLAAGKPARNATA